MQPIHSNFSVPIRISRRDYFRFADDLSLIEPRQSRARQMPAYQA
jgi:hypothetical protein